MATSRQTFCSAWAVLMLLQTADALSILAVFPYPGKSHHLVFDPILLELAARGHGVTVVSNFPQKNPPQNFTDVSIADAKSLAYQEVLTFDAFTPRGGHKFAFKQHFFEAFSLFHTSKEACSKALNHPNVQKLLDSKKTFDLLIVEQFNSDCGYAFSYNYKIPTVGIASHVLMTWTYARFGLPDNPAYIPSHYLGHGSHPTFIQRLDSLLTNAFYKMAYKLKAQRDDRATARLKFPNIPNLEAIAKNTSLLLVNSFTPLTGSRPWTSNTIEIGGVHVGKAKPLNTELETFVSGAKHGVVYVSFGSMVKASSMPRDKLEAFLGAIAELPQRFLWKWENETMPGAPPNLLVKKWMPQLDILSHKNVKVFISHGGMLGTTEAIHTGVPMLAIPLFGDQFANAAAVRESGLGSVLQFEDITKENLLKSLRPLLEPKMHAKAKRLSQMWHDRPMSPLDTAVYWIEYVARYGGAPHLRSAAVDLPLYQYLLLDVLAFLGAIVAVALYAAYKIFKFLYGLCFAPAKAAAPVKPKNKKSKKE